MRHKTKLKPSHESSVLDDLRIIRRRIEEESGGSMHKHVADTIRLTRPLVKKLGLKRVSSKSARDKS